MIPVVAAAVVAGMGLILLLVGRVGVSATKTTAIATIVLLTALTGWTAITSHRATLARARVEMSLRESEQRLFNILEAMPVGVFVVDAAGRAHYANRHSQELLGRGLVADATSDQLPETYQAYDPATGEVYPAERQPIARALHGERAYVDDIEIRRPDRSVPIEVWASPVYGSDGRLTHAVAAFSDISERLEQRREIAALNDQLSRQVQELAAVNGELETFCYSVSHDLRAPLRAVGGFARILEEDHGPHLDGEARRVIRVIQDNAQRMGTLIDDLLRFSRLSRKPLHTAAVDMTALARHAANDLLAHQSYDRAQLEVRELPTVVGDASLLGQVWANLIDNALKYSGTREQPKVVVTGTIEQDEAVYRVEDNGVGFDMAYVDQVFAVFQRLHTVDQFEGTGVGVPIIQRIVQRHGGRVWAESQLDHGTVFSFALPTRNGHG